MNGTKATTRYGETVTIMRIIGNAVYVYGTQNTYHVTKLFVNGKSLASQI